MKRLICILLAVALALCAGTAYAAPAVLTDRQLEEMEAVSASDPLAVDFSALESGLAAMADLFSEPGARAADPARAASFDGMAGRAQLLCFAAADTLEERYVENYDLQRYLDLSALSLARCFWQLARLDKAAQNASAYKSHLERAGKIYYDCAVQYAIANGRLFDGIEKDFDFLLAYFAYSGETGGFGRQLVNDLLGLESEQENRPFTDFFLANEEEIDRLLADTGTSLSDYPDRGLYSVDGNPREIGEILFDGEIPYVALIPFLNRFGGSDLTDYGANAGGRTVHWQLYGDDIRADEQRVLLNGEELGLYGTPFWSGGQLYLTLEDACYLVCADAPVPEEMRYYPSPLSDETATGEVYVVRPYLGEEPPSEEELTLLEGIGAPINLQNAIWYRSLSRAGAADLAPELLCGVSGMTRGTENSAYARELLSGSWGILTADDLRGSYAWLLEEGHRFDFRRVVSSGGAPDWFLRKWGDDLDENSFLAWDLARAVQICQWGCCAGYLSPSEATRLALDAAQTLRGSFDSWQEFADDYQMGYDAFLASDAEGDSYTALRREIIEQIYAGGSYRGVSWEPLPGQPAAGALPALVSAVAVWLLLTLVTGSITLILVLYRNRRRRHPAVSVDPWELP